MLFKARRSFSDIEVNVDYTIIGDVVELPLPSLDGVISVERALACRRSVREYTEDPINLQELLKYYGHPMVLVRLTMVSRLHLVLVLHTH